MDCPSSRCLSRGPITRETNSACTSKVVPMYWGIPRPSAAASRLESPGSPSATLPRGFLPTPEWQQGRHKSHGNSPPSIALLRSAPQ